MRYKTAEEKRKDTTRSSECVYIIACENDKWYVGHTHNLSQANRDHYSTPSKVYFTHENKPIKTIYNITAKRFVMSYVTHYMIDRYGKDNVKCEHTLQELPEFIEPKILQLYESINLHIYFYKEGKPIPYEATRIEGI